jgi:hypothetical protein
MEEATCSRQLACAASNGPHATDNMQRTTGNIQQATYNRQHATYNRQRRRHHATEKTPYTRHQATCAVTEPRGSLRRADPQRRRRAHHKALARAADKGPARSAPPRHAAPRRMQTCDAARGATCNMPRGAGSLGATRGCGVFCSIRPSRPRINLPAVAPLITFSLVQHPHPTAHCRAVRRC